MTRTQQLRAAGIILFALLAGLSIFLGNQRPAHALEVPSGSQIVCVVFTTLNGIGNPIPVLTADECEATSTPSGTGTIQVIKEVVGSSASAADFEIHVKSGLADVSGSPQLGSTAGTFYAGLPADPVGVYVISEGSAGDVDLADYTTTFSGHCPAGVVTLSEGETVVCTVTNTFNAPPGSEDTLAECSDTVDNDNDELIDLADPDCASFAPTLTIIKNTTGGDATFNFTVSGATSESASVLTSGGTGTSDPINLAVGTSSVLEDAAVDWTLSSVSCSDGESSVGTPVTRGMELSVAIGDDLTCTFANTFIEGGGGGGDGGGSDVSVAKAVDNATPNRGDTITYTLTVSVSGDDAINVVVHDALPAGLTFVSTSTADIVGVYNAATGDWTIGALGSSTPATLHIIATVNDNLDFGAVVSNSVSVSAGDTSGNGDNDSASASFTVTSPTSNGDGGGGNNQSSTASSGSSGGGGGGGRSGSRATTPQGQVLGEATTTPQMCSTPLLYTYLRKGKANNPAEVKKLQQFLNRDPDTRVALTGPGSPGNETGFFGPLTDAAVRKFQVKYAKDVLEPWQPYGLVNHNSTGYVYKTTQRKINLLYCASLVIPMPRLP